MVMGNHQPTNFNIQSVENHALKAHEAGQFSDAEAMWRQVLSVQPNHSNAAHNLGIALKLQGRAEDAIPYFEQARRLSFVPSYLELAAYHSSNGRHIDAQSLLEQALKLDEKNHLIWAEIGKNYHALGKAEHAILILLKALELKPKYYAHITALHDILMHYKLSVYNQNFEKALLLCLESDDIGHKELLKTWFLFIESTPNVKDFWQSALTLTYADLYQLVLNKPDSAIAFFQHPVVIKGVQKISCRTPLYEDCLTNIRRVFLQLVHDGHPIPAACHDFLCALAEQCFFNEHVFSFQQDETKKVESIYEETKTTAYKDIKNIQSKLLILLCYKSLYMLENSAAIAKFLTKSGDNAIKSVVRVHYDEPEEEKRIKRSLQSFGDIQDSISQKVQAQYEENPYPRWRSFHKPIETGYRYNQIIGDTAKIRNILIAGCGTGQHIVVTRHSFPHTPITAIDISKSSLAYAKRKMRGMKLKNIEFFHGDILELDALNHQYDMICCGGVLHHMDTPIEGFKSLLRRLKPGGVMQIGLYSEYARSAVIKAKNIIQDQQFESTPDGIRACRSHLKSLPTDDPLYVNALSVDFYSLSECRDLLFHVQEHRFTIPELASIFDELNLEFMGFFNSTAITADYKTMFPNDPNATNLDNWDQFEQKYPNSFAGMYQFWVKDKTVRNDE